QARGPTSRAKDYVGTLEYLSPERFYSPSDISVRSDIYSVGVVLYELLTGQCPFGTREDGEEKLRERVLNDDPSFPAQSAVPADLKAICLKCMHKNATQRYATPSDLVEDLGRYLVGKSVQARPVGAGERLVRWYRRNPAVISLVTALALGLVAWLVAGFVAIAQQTLRAL